jgi:hypothetical protein
MNARLLSVPAPPPPPRSPDNRWLTEWRRRDFLELGALDTAPGSARGHIVSVLAEWAMPDFTEAVPLVVSELITNSLRATRQLRWEGLVSATGTRRRQGHLGAHRPPVAAAQQATSGNGRS